MFTQAHGGRRPVPWGQIDVGDIVWMKWSGGPIVAKARVSSFTCMDSCTASRLRKAVEGYRLHEVAAYWKALMQRGPFFGMAVFLEDEEWLPHALAPKGRSRSESWIVLDTSAARKDWLGHAADEKAKQGSRTVPDGLRFKVFQRDGFACWYCGASAADGVKLQVDHIVPWSHGGKTVLSNLRTACGPCNRGKGATRVA